MTMTKDANAWLYNPAAILTYRLQISLGPLGVKMGGLSIWHWLILLILILFCVLPPIFFRKSIRRFFIATAEFLLLFANLIFVLGCGFAGAVWLSGGFLIGGAGRFALGFAFGAAAGLLIAVIFSAVFFILLEIADNTRKTVSFFERVNNRAQHRDHNQDSYSRDY